MGINVYVVRHDKKELFDLGKECLFHLLDDRDKLWTLDKSELLEQIVYSWRHNDNMTCGYALYVRDLIWEWIQGANDKDLGIIADWTLEDPPYSDEKFNRVYKITGDRYYKNN